MAYKVRSKYRAYTASELDGRFSPTCTHSVSGNDVNCSEITTTKVRNVIGGPNNSVSSLCTYTAGINKWSAFGPIVRTITGSPAMLTNSLGGSPYKLGDFGGYNDDAVIPAYYTSPLGVTKSIIANEAVHWEISIDIGEPLYSNEIVGYESAVHGIAMSLWSDDGNLLFQTKGSTECPMAEVIDIELVKSRVDFGSSSGGYRLTGTNIHKASTPSTPYYGSVETRIELVEEDGDGVASVPEIASYYDPGTVLCQIPGLEHFHTTLRLKQANSISVTGNMTSPTFGSSGSTPAVNWNDLVVTSNGLVCYNSKGTSLVVTMWVTDYLGITLTDVYTIRRAASGAYTSGTNVIVEDSTYYTDPGSDIHNENNGALSRCPWTLGGTSLGTVPAYDLILRIDFSGN